ncbi:MAG: hypothetical protein MJK10_21940 [Pseudomonadales bacterium]|nr:hypothetical protein [Pseudomonadales bacterium]NRA16433.1 hypothetical protein [Oceanospirillaceae bacterium]
MIKSVKVVIILLIISLSAWVIYHAGRLAIADVIHYPVKSWIESVDANEPVSGAELDKAEDKILRSISFNPDNAEYQEYLGRIHYLRAIGNFHDGSLFQENIQKAYLAHKQAIKLRPKWPYSWANLALIKSHQQQLDVEYLYAVNQAVRFGPWEISSNEALVQAGFNGWLKLSKNSQQITIDALVRIYQQTPKAARKLLAHYSAQDTVCPLLTLEKFKKDKICSNNLIVTPS